MLAPVSALPHGRRAWYNYRCLHLPRLGGPPVFYITGSIILIDYISKRLVERLMVEGQSLPLIPGILRLTYVRNPGAAFGILADQTWFFVMMAVVIAGVIVFARKALTGGERLLQMALAIALAGVLGNLIDRVTRDRHVVDFLELPHWPVFNVADMALLAGIGLYLFGTFRGLALERRGGPQK